MFSKLKNKVIWVIINIRLIKVNKTIYTVRTPEHTNKQAIIHLSRQVFVSYKKP